VLTAAIVVVRQPGRHIGCETNIEVVRGISALQNVDESPLAPNAPMDRKSDASDDLKISEASRKTIDLEAILDTIVEARIADSAVRSRACRAGAHWVNGCAQR
jgi:hypothetical protein